MRLRTSTRRPTWLARGLLLAVALLTAPASTSAQDARPEASTEAASSADTEPESDVLDDDPRVRTLRFADRRLILLRLGFGGKFDGPDDFLDDSKAKPSYGVTLRWDRPVHEYVTTGLGLSFYAAQPEGDFREPVFDIVLNLKGRYPFLMGRGERKFESEVYVLFHMGLLIWIDSASLTLDIIGPGWTTGVSVGYQFFINNRVGLVSEVGWSREEAFFSRGRVNILLNQAAVRFGLVFPF